MCVQMDTLIPFSMQAFNLKTVIAISHFTQTLVGKKNKLENTSLHAVINRKYLCNACHSLVPWCDVFYQDDSDAY